MSIIYILSSLFTLGVIGLVFFRAYINFSKLKNIKEPIRQLTTEEERYLEPYLVQAMKLRDNNVYQVAGGSLSIETTQVQGNTLTKLKFEGIEVLFPYSLEAFIDNVNTIELVVVSVSLGHLVGMVVGVNGVALKDLAEVFWLRYENPNTNIFEPNIVSSRLETEQERKLRLSQLWYGGSSAALITAIVCLFIIIYMFPSTGVVLLTVAVLFLILAIFSFFKIRNKYKDPQEVLKISGYLTTLELRNIQKVFDTSREFYFTPQHHVRFMDGVTKFSFTYEYYDEDIEYTAEITEAKDKGYYLLSLVPFAPLDPNKSLIDVYKKKTKTLTKRTLLWLSIAIVPLGLLWPHYDILITTPNVVFTGYSNYKDVINSPPQVGEFFRLKDNHTMTCQIEEGKAVDGRKVNQPNCSKLIFSDSHTKTPDIPEYINNLMFLEDKIRGYGLNEQDKQNLYRENIRKYLADAEKSCAFDSAFDCESLYQSIYRELFPDSYIPSNYLDYYSEVQQPESYSKEELLTLIDSMEISSYTYQDIVDWIRVLTKSRTKKYWENYFETLTKQDSTSLDTKLIVHLPDDYIFELASGSVIDLYSRYKYDKSEYWLNAANIITTDYDSISPYLISGEVIDVQMHDGVVNITLDNVESDFYIKQLSILLLMILSLVTLVATIGGYFVSRRAIKSGHAEMSDNFI